MRNLIKTQEDLRNYIENFSFLLGFSGFFFQHGDSIEVDGDKKLIGKFLKFLFNNFFVF